MTDNSLFMMHVQKVNMPLCGFPSASALDTSGGNVINEALNSFNYQNKLYAHLG